MTASPALLLVIYCAVIAGCSLLGGLVPSIMKLGHTGTQLIMSLVSGLMLGVAFYHLLPHAVVMHGGPLAVDVAVWWLMTGLIAMLLLLRLFHFHTHDLSPEQEHYHDHTPAEEASVHGLSWAGIAVGLALHTLIDGVALGAAMRGGHADEAWLGMGVFLAIALHKPLDSMSIVTLMKAGGWSRRARRMANVGFALLCPLGALLFYFGVDLLADSGTVVAAALAFSAGAFICIALSDLLPEVHFHSHDRGKLTLALLLGITLAYAIGSFEPAGLHASSH